jgi:hypothetical protein
MGKQIQLNGEIYEAVERDGERMQIICCHRGFVFVGIVADSELEVVIRQASCVRKWGTTSGLGEIAINGPTDNTVLDFVGTVRVHPLSVVCRIDCEADKW